MSSKSKKEKAVDIDAWLRETFPKTLAEKSSELYVPESEAERLENDAKQIALTVTRKVFGDSTVNK